MIQFAGGTVCSLAEAQPNQLVRVERILYRTLRELLAGIGLHEGDQLLCRGSYRSRVILQAETGRRVIVNQEWARFIRVRTRDG